MKKTKIHGCSARGQLYNNPGRRKDAEAAFLRAAAADSADPSTFQWQGELYASLGRATDAVRAMERARALDPMAPIINGELSYIRALAGQRDSAVAAGRRAIDLAPALWTGHAFLGSAQLWLGNAREAVSLLEEAMRLAPQNPFGGVPANAVAAAGDNPRATAMVRALEVEARAGRASPATVAIGLVGIGEHAEAIAWLERAHTARTGCSMQRRSTPPGVWLVPCSY